MGTGLALVLTGVVEGDEMFFFPYRADIEQWRFPLITLLVCAACAIMQANQYQQSSALELKLARHCYENVDKEFELALQHVAASNGVQPQQLCIAMLYNSYLADNAEDQVRKWASLAPTKEIYIAEYAHRKYINSIFQHEFSRFSHSAPYPLTQKLWFDPSRIVALDMVTSIFAHADLMHLLGNLFFFFAFAATVEMIIGSLSLAATIALLAVVTNTFYALISFLEGVYIPTLGLSGIVFGMMGMFVCFLPCANIRCFFYLFIVYKRFSIPAWLLVGSYVCWNIYSWIATGNISSVNFIVHISGALFGYLIALTVFRTSKRKYDSATIVRAVNRKFLYAER